MQDSTILKFKPTWKLWDQVDPQRATLYQKEAEGHWVKSNKGENHVLTYSSFAGHSRLGLHNSREHFDYYPKPKLSA